MQTFALALHELTINALKHGALSDPEGALRVAWRVVRDENGAPRLRVEWVERRETPRAEGEEPPPGSGYGRELIENALPHQLWAETEYELRSS